MVYPNSFISTPAARLSLLSLLFLWGCADRENAQISAGIEAVTLQHTEVWSKGNIELIPSVYAEEYIGHFPGGRTVIGREGIRTTIENLRTAFPDWTETIEHILVDGDHVVTVYRSTGTHDGEFFGNPATGNEVEIMEASVYRVSDGRIVEQWAFPDFLSLQNQTASQ